MIALAAVAAATGNQVIGSPAGWERTAGGYAARLGDQAGFAMVEETVRLVWQRTAGWSSDTTPCPWQRTGSATVGPSVGGRLGCAAHHTFRLVDRGGRRHVNWPLLAGVGTASLTSLAWRPERRSAAKGRAMVATRVSIVLGSTFAKQLLAHWWEDRRRR